MNDALFENTKLAAYFLWEVTGCSNAMDLWYCAEDMACYFEREGILDETRVNSVMQLDVCDPGYIFFLRHVAYRIYIYTNRPSAPVNWYDAEKLLANGEWVRALTDMATIYRNEMTNNSLMNELRSDNVRAYYAR